MAVGGFKPTKAAEHVVPFSLLILKTALAVLFFIGLNIFGLTCELWKSEVLAKENEALKNVPKKVQIKTTFENMNTSLEHV